MRLLSTVGEELAIKTICSPRKEVAGTMLAAVDRDVFATPSGLEAYDYIQKVMLRRGETPTFEALCADARLSEETREKLNEVTRSVRTTEAAQQLADRLIDFRRKRQVYRMSKHTLEVMDKATVDVDELIAYLQDSVSKIAQTKSHVETIYHIGRDDTTLPIAKSILYDERPAVFIPTGYKTFDVKNGGYLRGQVTILGGYTGSGKSQRFDTEISLSTLVFDLDDDVTMEVDANQLLCVRSESGMVVMRRACNLAVGDELVLDSDELESYLGPLGEP